MAGCLDGRPAWRFLTVLQKVKRGELRAALTRTGRRKGLRIELPAPQQGLF